MKFKFFKRRCDIDNHSTIITKVEETNRCLFITFTSWTTPKEYCDDISQPTIEAKRLDKSIRTNLWKSLSNQDYFYQDIYLTELVFPQAMLPINQQVFMKLEIVVYRKTISDERPDIDKVTHITNRMYDIFDNNPYYNFNRNKAF